MIIIDDALEFLDINEQTSIKGVDINLSVKCGSKVCLRPLSIFDERI